MSKILVCSLATLIFVGIFAEIPQREPTTNNLPCENIKGALFFEGNARQMLANIREKKGKEIVDLPVYTFLWNAFYSGHDLAYYETSGADLHKALYAGWVHEAKEYFTKASDRCRFEAVEIEINFMLTNLAKAGMKPCEIGVSEELVEKILRFGYYSATVSQMIRAANAPNQEKFLSETKDACYFFERLKRKNIFKDDKELFLIEPFTYLGNKINTI